MVSERRQETGNGSGCALRSLPRRSGALWRYAESSRRRVVSRGRAFAVTGRCRDTGHLDEGFLAVSIPAGIHETGRESATHRDSVRPLYVRRKQRSLVNRVLVLQKGLFDPPRGGARPGAGRKPKKGRRRVPHTKRSRVTRHDVIHVTQRIDTHGFSLRTGKVLAVLRACFTAGAERFGFRLIEYSIQRDHLHLIVEAEDARALSRGMQGLKIRMAKSLNRLWSLKGPRFPDRYHEHVMKKLREVRNALNYVLNNARHHGHRIDGVDPFSSGASFKGWRDAEISRPPAATSASHSSRLAAAKSWLLNKGWHRWGLLSPHATPGNP
jgi:putative transposase